MVGLALALALPLVLLQMYQVYIGPISVEVQLAVGVILSIAAGLALYLTCRTSARNHP